MYTVFTHAPVITYDLETFTQLTPNLVMPNPPMVYQESSIAFVGGKWGYSASCAIPGAVAKFGPLLRRCDSTGITLTGKTSRSSITLSSGVNKAAHGPTIKYQVTLANTNSLSGLSAATKKNNTALAASAFDPAGLVVTLPAGASYVKASVIPRPTVPGVKPVDKTLAAAVYDPVENTLTWPDVPLVAGKKRKYTVWAKVLPSATSPLTFEAECPNCPDLNTQSDVTVRAAQGRDGWLHADRCMQCMV